METAVTKVPASATGAQERIRIQRVEDDGKPGGVILSGSITEFNWPVGSFSALFDVQRPGDMPLTFTPAADGHFEMTSPQTGAGGTWRLVQ